MPLPPVFRRSRGARSLVSPAGLLNHGVTVSITLLNPNFVLLGSDWSIGERQHVAGSKGTRTERLGETWRSDCQCCDRGDANDADFRFHHHELFSEANTEAHCLVTQEVGSCASNLQQSFGDEFDTLLLSGFHLALQEMVGASETYWKTARGSHLLRGWWPIGILSSEIASSLSRVFMLPPPHGEQQQREEQFG